MRRRANVVDDSNALVGHGTMQTNRQFHVVFQGCRMIFLQARLMLDHGALPPYKDELDRLIARYQVARSLCNTSLHSNPYDYSMFVFLKIEEFRWIRQVGGIEFLIKIQTSCLCDFASQCLHLRFPTMASMAMLTHPGWSGEALLATLSLSE